jgi:AraC-like DNA-binding protein
VLLSQDAFRRLCLARDLLGEVHDEPISIEAIAREVGASPFHLSRQFEALFGVTPHQFRIQTRLDRARLLLSSGSRSVTDVCMEVGCSSLGSFSALFARRVGVAPSEYQRRLRPLVVVPGGLSRHLVPGCLSLMAYAAVDRSFREASAVPTLSESSLE